MLDENKICPYTGLRPFSEEESLYFKGRDEHIEQATKQLGKNKFLILTGASGDGKSSLVYAGIVPNARAGFLKSTYSNWAVADFRPERSPFHNLCKAIALQLGIPQVETVKSELSHGFSALVDLYKASALYYNENDHTGQEPDAKTKTVLKRKAANLLILADQFEEFFTNPENYHKGIPSGEANLVTNLLLETAQLALEENLPIYVVITMRSDFIGQCAAFRGLPEYIGFSQFFVPRLNRKQLQEVIEEPARLNGDKISRRLTERLIHDMVEGTDQLPILQHALNQIWKMAANGEEELDLLHYAMVGGMEGSRLPEQDVQQFSLWFAGLPEKIRSCYQSPGLQNVLNTHANRLFNQAQDHVKEKHGLIVSGKDIELIIETAFRCLTKIDNGRAVRNRMSLAEITAILNEHHLDDKTLGNVLDIFREPGNTLLKPYIDDRPESIELKQETVLDITHESLIRNWEYLGKWAREEYSHYLTFLDFEQQLNRWIQSGKSSAFLLYIGPLTYFESWFNKVKPNAAWIARYQKEEETTDLKRTRSEEILSNAHEFIRKSGRKHWATRTVMRYGPRRIAAVLGLMGLLVLSIFSIRNYLGRRDTVVQSQIKEKIMELANNPKVTRSNKIGAVIMELELGQTNITEVIHRIDNPLDRIDFSTALASNLIFFSQKSVTPSKEMDESLLVSDSLLDAYRTPGNLDSLNRLLMEANDLMYAMELRYYYSRSPQIDRLLIKNAKRTGALAKHILNKKPAGFIATTELNTALEHALNHHGYSTEEISELIKVLSPFENPVPNEWLGKIYSKSNLDGRGFFPGYGPRFNGLYRELAYLYGSVGKTELALRCVDTLLFYNQNYYQNDFANLSDNASNIPVYFYLYGHSEESEAFVKGYCEKKNMSEEEFYARLLARSSLSATTTGTLELDLGFSNMRHNTNLEYGRDDQLAFFFEGYREAVNKTISNADARNFDLALSYKNEALLYAKRLQAVGAEPDPGFLKAAFDQAIGLFHKVSSSYLNQSVQISIGEAPRQTLFTYPDYLTPFHPWEPRGFLGTYTSGAFLDYLIATGYFDEFSRTARNLEDIRTWMKDYDQVRDLGAGFGITEMDPKLLSGLSGSLAKKGVIQDIDLNMLHINLANQQMKSGKVEEAMVEYGLIQPKYLHDYLKTAYNPSPAFFEIARGVASLMSQGKSNEAEQLISGFPGPVNKATLYAYAARVMVLHQSLNPLLPSLLDSCRNEMSRDESGGRLYRIQMTYTLAMRGGANDLKEAIHIMKNVTAKSLGIGLICRSLSYRGSLYDAWKFIPDNSSDNNVANYLKEILYGRLLTTQPETVFWRKFESKRWVWLSEFMFYDN